MLVARDVAFGPMGVGPLAPQTVEAILKKAQEVRADPTRFADYADYPIEFARDVLGVRRLDHQPAEFFPNECGLWTKQQDILTAVRDHRRVCAKSGHLTGKSFAFAILVAWWFLSRQARVLSTGPTKFHIEDVLWPEIHELVRKSLVPLPGQLDALNWKVDNYWYATGITTDTQGAFQGRHHPRLLGLMDEAAAVLDFIHTELDTCAGGEFNHVAMVGNPTVTSGRFYDAFQNPDIWYPITISCLEHPNILAKRELIPGAISVEQIAKWKKEWGETHPFWFSRVLGDFPQISEKGIIPLLWLNRAKNLARWSQALQEAEARREPRVAGIDVARYGQNKCVFSVRRGDALEHMESWGHTSTTQTAGKLIRLHDTWGFKTLGVDAAGLGAGVFDMLMEQPLQFDVHGHNGGHKAGREGMYSNRRSELWMHLRNRLEKERLWLPPQHPDIDRLSRDLLAPEYEITAAGRFKAETKEDLLARGVRSPDHADSLMLCFAVEADPDAELDHALPIGQDQSVYREIYDTAPPQSEFESLPDGF